jgi:DNA-binding beta-propeller fold protein YncE
LSAVALIVLVSLLHPSSFNGAALHTSEAIAAPTRSTTIALISDEKRLVVVNREANSVSIIQVKDDNGNDVAIKLDEIAVGQEPRCVAVHPTDRAAYVTNGISGTVSVVDLVLGREWSSPRHRAAAAP